MWTALSTGADRVELRSARRGDHVSITPTDRTVRSRRVREWPRGVRRVPLPRRRARVGPRFRSRRHPGHLSPVASETRGGSRLVAALRTFESYLQCFKAKAHPFTGVDEADNCESIHTRCSGWIFDEEKCLYSLIRSNHHRRKTTVTPSHRGRTTRTHRRIGVTAAWLSQHSSGANHNIPTWESHDFSRVEEVNRAGRTAERGRFQTVPTRITRWGK